MSWSWTIGAVRGVKVKIHFTFLLVVLWAAYNWGVTLRRGASGAIFGILLIVALFLCVVLHELAHCFAAMHYGVKVREIELSPIGGIAKMDSVPSKPQQEFAMSLVGPLANLLVAAPLGGLVYWMQQARAIRSVGHLIYLMGRPSWQALVLNLFISNLMLALFNLLPAFPMDGGRILRSVLAWGMGRGRATRWAVVVGQTIASVMGLAGLLTSNLILVLIAGLIFAGAHQEVRFAQLQDVLGQMRVSEALISPVPALSVEDTLDVVLDRAKHGHAGPFAVMGEGQLKGWLTHVDIRSAMATYGTQVRVGDIMRKDFVRVLPNETLFRARQIMATSGAAGLPVMEGNLLLGMISVQQIQEIYLLLSAQREQAQG